MFALRDFRLAGISLDFFPRRKKKELKMKRRILCAMIIFVAIGLAGCRNGREPQREPEITLSAVRITGIPDSVGILMTILDGGTPRSRGLAAVGGTIASEDGEYYAVSEIRDGTAVTPLYYGADIMFFLLAVLDFPPPVGMEPPIAVPSVINTVVSGRGDVVIYYSSGLDTLMSAEGGTMVWRNIRFEDFTENRTLVLDWGAATN